MNESSSGALLLWVFLRVSVFSVFDVDCTKFVGLSLPNVRVEEPVGEAAGSGHSPFPSPAHHPASGPTAQERGGRCCCGDDAITQGGSGHTQTRKGQEVDICHFSSSPQGKTAVCTLSLLLFAWFLPYFGFVLVSFFSLCFTTWESATL